MKYLRYKIKIGIRGILPIVLVGILFATPELRGQEPPPRPITVTVTAQGLSFGTFTQGPGGGSVTVSETGVRSSTGDIILLNMVPMHSTALLEVVGNPGTLVSLLNGPDAILTGSNGGSVSLHIGASDPPSPFVITSVPPLSTLLNIGGVLTVGSPALNPPGTFSGTFNITFIQE